MKILNEQVDQALMAGTPIKLDLGCGESPRPGFFGIDHLEMSRVDIVADLNKPLDLLPDQCCDHLYSRHCLEHVSDLLLLMREIHRIMRPQGRVEITVPHFSNVYGFSDPTHLRLFGCYSMYYFVAPHLQPLRRQVPAFYSDVRFRLHSIKIQFYRHTRWDRLVAPIMTKFVNMSFATQNFYERRLAAFFHASQITYVLEPDID